VLQKTPFSFDVSVWELFLPLVAGATLVVATPEGHRDPAYLAELVRGAGVTTMHFVPSMLKAFLGAEALPRCVSLRHVVCSGEALSAEAARAFFAQSDAALHNLYGPTECAVDVTSHRCERGRDDAAVPIGRPIANARVHVLDPELRPCPVGVPGELVLGGLPVGRGYVGRPGLTAERFLPDPLADAPGSRAYRTGDRCRVAPGGAVEFLGRLDHQIKLRGFRIELGEIESVLARVPGVGEVAALVHEGAGEARLVAYVVAREPRPSVETLRSALRERVPEYMVPSAFVLLDALPLTPSGKLDRRALPAPDARAGVATAYAPPRNDVDELLAIVWAEVFGVERVGIHDDFFALGGHSLLATQIVARLRDLVGLEVSLRSLFERPTIAAITDRLMSSPEASAAVERASLLVQVARLSDDEAAAMLDGDRVPTLVSADPTERS
jgi:acyl-coenzyme A synthetase/AMP-(fatty) acid ligase